MSAIILAEETAVELEKLAQPKGTTAAALAEQAIREFIRQETRRALQEETAVFQQLHHQLLEKYPGQYVAIYQSQLIDHDSDQLALYLRVRQEHPDEPVLIKEVTLSPEEVYTFRSPRITFLAN
jgi:hypothetical protein